MLLRVPVGAHFACASSRAHASFESATCLSSVATTRLFWSITSSPASGRGTWPGASSAPPSAPTWRGGAPGHTGCRSWGRAARSSLRVFLPIGLDVRVQVLSQDHGNHRGQAVRVSDQRAVTEEWNLPLLQVLATSGPVRHPQPLVPGRIVPVVLTTPLPARITPALVVPVGVPAPVLHMRRHEGRYVAGVSVDTPHGSSSAARFRKVWATSSRT